MADALPPPTPELAELGRIIGLKEARELARTFVTNTPKLIQELANQNPADPSAPTPTCCQLAAHNLKSTSRLVGAHGLAALASMLENRILDDGPVPTSMEIDHARAAFVRFIPPLVQFVETE